MADELPAVEVSHLASSSSFYSAILQPLGLTYMDADGRSPAVVTFEAKGEAVLQLRYSPAPRLSSVLVGAPSTSALVRFHDCGLRANPPMLLQGRPGALLGVAAGAALTYGMVSRDRDGRPAAADSHRAHQQDDGPGCRRIALSYPGRQGVLSALDRRGCVPQRSPPWATPHSADGQSVARSQVVDDDYDARSRSEAPSQRAPSQRASSQRASSQRAPSQRAPSQQASSRYRAPSQRAPLSAAAALGERGGHGRPPRQPGGSPRAVCEAEPSTYVSAPSRRTSTPQQPRSENRLPYRANSVSAAQEPAATGPPVARSSRTQSCVSARHIPLPASQAPSCVSARRVPLPASQAPSYLSARHMPLPPSGVGSSHANWDDDLDSLAPSDSISCVGSGAGSSRRSRRRRASTVR